MSSEEAGRTWRTVRFGGVVREVKQTTKDPAADGLDRVVGLDHLDRGSLPLRRWDELADLPDGTSFTRTFKAGQVLFGKRRAYQRKVAVPDFDGICSSDILVFEPSAPDLLHEFLPYLVQSDGFFDHALGTSAGSLSPRTKWQELAKYEFRLPPTDEQQRIVEVLGAVDGVLGSHARVLERARSVSSSVVAQAVEGAERQPLGDVLRVVTKGTTPTSLGFNFSDTGIAFLKAENVLEGRVTLDEVAWVSQATHEILGRSVLQQNDVLLTIAGTIGRAAVVPVEALPANCNQAVAILRPADGVSPTFLAAWLQSDDAVTQIRRAQRSNTISNLSLSMIRSLQFPVLGSAQQVTVLEKLMAADGLTTSVSQHLLSTTEMSGVLRESLLSGGEG